MFDVTETLLMVLLPALLALAGFAALAALRRRPRPALAGPGADGAVLAIAVGAAWLGLRGGFHDPTADVHDWLPWFALLAAAASVLVSTLRPAWARAGVLAVAIAAMLGLVIGQLPVCHGWSSGEKVVWFGGLGLGWLASAWAWRRSAQAAGTGVAVAALIMAVACGAFACLLFGGMRHAKLAAPLLAAFGALVVVGWWRRWPFPAAGVATASALILPLLLTFGYFLDEVPLWGLPLLALSGLAAWPTAWGRLRAAAGWRRLLVAGLIAGVVAAPVLIHGIVKSIHDSGEAPY